MNVFDVLPKKMGQSPCPIYANKTNSSTEQCNLDNEWYCCKTEPNLWYLWFLVLFVVIIVMFILAVLGEVLNNYCYKKKVPDIELTSTTIRFEETNSGPRNYAIPEICITLLGKEEEPVVGPPAYELALSAPRLHPDNRIPSYEDVMAAQQKNKIKRLSF